MKKVWLLLSAAAYLALVPVNVYAWGKKGHNIVAEIAFSLLDSGTQQKVQQYLGQTTIADASTWMDDVRKDPAYDYMKPWHYVNIEKGSQYQATTKGNIVNALNTSIDALQHRDKLSDEEIKKNLMIIFHLTGDLHMPLHIGYAGDKGGNDVKVTYLSKQSNLHWVWDTEIIEHENISTADCMRMYNHFSTAEIAALKTVDVTNWIYEPRALLYKVYDYKGDHIDQDYSTRNKPLIEEQLLIAGIRLAAVLEQVFKS